MSSTKFDDDEMMLLTKDPVLAACYPTIFMLEVVEVPIVRVPRPRNDDPWGLLPKRGGRAR